MQVRIAELEILPEWLDAYLEAAGAVGAESVAKEPGVVCIFPMQKKESPTSSASACARLRTPATRLFKAQAEEPHRRRIWR